MWMSSHQFECGFLAEVVGPAGLLRDPSDDGFTADMALLLGDAVAVQLCVNADWLKPHNSPGKGPPENW